MPILEKYLRIRNKKNLSAVIYFAVLLAITTAFQDSYADVLVPDSAFEVTKHPEHERNTFFPPLISFFLPGFDQWWEGQYSYAFTYTGLGLAGDLLIASSNVQQVSLSDLGTRDPQAQQFLFGESIYKVSTGLSVYQSFRTAVNTHHDDYKFLDKKYEESLSEINLAPFHFSYLERPTTYIPLLLLTVASALDFSGNGSSHWYALQTTDFGMTASMSYGAGVGEETVFRGFLMPVARNLTGSDWIANGISSTVFAAAHISSDYQYPVAQFLFGTYVAWLSQYRNWTLAEGIFIHTWWDTISILSEYAATQKINHFAISPIKIEF